MKTVAVIQARMGSSRLPGKVLQNLGGKLVLVWVINAAKQAHGVDEVVVATSDLPADDIIAQKCTEWDVSYFRGSESDVLDRFMGVAEYYHADFLLRLTGDCPFHDPQVIGEVIRLRKVAGAQYASNIDPPTWPDGLDVEIFSRELLEVAHKEAIRGSDRDCVTRFMARNRSRFPSATLTCPIPGLHKERWVLDTSDDMRFCQEIASRLPQNWTGSYLEILEILDEEPNLRFINSHHPRNERFYEGINSEELGPYSYPRSKKALARAREIIPLGAQTFSKSYVQFPGDSPLFVSHGDGAYIYDVDGNEFVDCMAGLLPVILGYRDPDVDRAVRNQLDSGVTLSLATELEWKLAHRIQGHLPSAEMVRFGKNGSDVTTVAVRLARAFTGRAGILNSGYHGWGADFVGDFGDRGRGVLTATRLHSRSLKHGDSESAIREVKKELYACVIVEPEDNPEFLQVLRDVCDETGTVLIFDEIITWPRWGMGGAQGHFGVKPDLTTISKAMANGMPISAICGRRDIMKLMEPPDNIFYSGTFQGEALSLAAAIACIDKLERENVVESIRSQNAYLNGEMFRLVIKHDVPVECHYLQGLTRVTFRDVGDTTGTQIASLFREVMAANGVLIINSNNLGWMHRDNEIKRVVRAYEEAFRAISKALHEGTLVSRAATAKSVRG
jgi:glutamate-1-semialdehyde 2,1-aminomutase